MWSEEGEVEVEVEGYGGFEGEFVLGKN